MSHSGPELAQGYTVTLSDEDALSLKVGKGPGRLAIGQREFAVDFRVGGPPPGQLEVPFLLLRASPLFVNLGWPLGLFRARRAAGSADGVGGADAGGGPEDGAVHLGPVVGVLVGSPPSTLAPEESYFLRLFHQEAAAKGAIACTFRPSDADLTRRTTAGFWPLALPGGAVAAPPPALWKMADFPLPDVVHNRTTLLAPEHKPAYGNVLWHYAGAEKGAPLFFTKGGLTKSHALDLMKAHPVAGPLVPSTRVIEAGPGREATDEEARWVATIFDFLDEYGQAYIKPHYGSQGEGIFRATALHTAFATGLQPRGEGYLIEYRSGQDNVAIRCDGRAAVLALLGPSLAKSPYLCQKAIPRPEVDGFPVDFRAYLTRDGAGGWQVAYLCARHAKGGAICSHRRYGGVVTPAAGLLARAFPDRVAAVTDAMAECALAVADAVSGRHGGDCCELAVDIAVDTGGRPWVLEVNDCPNRLPADDEWVRRATARAVANLVDYLILAAGAGSRSGAGAGSGPEGRRLVRLMPT